jgi:hypothetical protein
MNWILLVISFKIFLMAGAYNVVTVTEDLVFDLTPDAPIPSVQDEFDQIYIRIPTDDNSTDTSTSSSGFIQTVSIVAFIGALGTWFMI